MLIDFFAVYFFVLFLSSPVLAVIGLINPKLVVTFGKPTRISTLGSSAALFTTSFILFGCLSTQVTKNSEGKDNVNGVSILFGSVLAIATVGGTINKAVKRNGLLEGNSESEFKIQSSGKFIRKTKPVGKDNLTHKLLEKAIESGGTITIVSASLATGYAPEVVELELNKLVKAGYILIDNDPQTGMIVYKVS